MYWTIASFAPCQGMYVGSIENFFGGRRAALVSTSERFEGTRVRIFWLHYQVLTTVTLVHQVSMDKFAKVQDNTPSRGKVDRPREKASQDS